MSRGVKLAVAAVDVALSARTAPPIARCSNGLMAWRVHQKGLLTWENAVEVTTVILASVRRHFL